MTFTTSSVTNAEKFESETQMRGWTFNLISVQPLRVRYGYDVVKEAVMIQVRIIQAVTMHGL